MDQAQHHFPDYSLTLDENDKAIFTNRVTSPREPMLPGLEDLPHLKPQTIKHGRKLVEQSGSGRDYEELRAQFTQSLLNGFKPEKTVDGAFINFLKKKLRERP